MAARMTASQAASQYSFSGRNAQSRFKSAFNAASKSGASARSAKAAGVKAANSGSGGG